MLLLPLLLQIISPTVSFRESHAARKSEFLKFSKQMCVGVWFITQVQLHGLPSFPHLREISLTPPFSKLFFTLDTSAKPS